MLKILISGMMHLGEGGYEENVQERLVRVREVKRVCDDETLASSVACVILSKHLKRNITVYELLSLKHELLKEAENPLHRPKKELLDAYAAKTDLRDFFWFMKYLPIERKEKVMKLLDKAATEEKCEPEDSLFGNVTATEITAGQHLDGLIGEVNREAALYARKIKLFVGVQK